MELFGCASWARVGALQRLLHACSEKCDSGRVMATGESREEEQRMPSRCISILLKKAFCILCKMTRVEFLRDAERLACDMQCERARVTKKGRYGEGCLTDDLRRADWRGGEVRMLLDGENLRVARGRWKRSRDGDNGEQPVTDAYAGDSAA